jgi:hypothetical protein
VYCEQHGMRTNLDPSERLRLIEQRRSAAEVSLWQLPSVSIAAQAFLLAVGLDPKAEDWARVLVGVVGILTVLATGFVVAFQGARVTVFGRWLAMELNRSLEERVLVTQLDEGGDPTLTLNRAQKSLLRLPTPFWFWGLTLIGFLVADVSVFIRGL